MLAILPSDAVKIHRFSGIRLHNAELHCLLFLDEFNGERQMRVVSILEIREYVLHTRAFQTHFVERQCAMDARSFRRSDPNTPGGRTELKRSSSNDSSNEHRK